MTTSVKDITELVDLHCTSIRFTELDRLLKKLDHEDLDVLRAMFEEVYDPIEAIADAYIQDLQDEYYDKGYKEGYDVAVSEIKADDRYEEGYSDGYNKGYADHE